MLVRNGTSPTPGRSGTCARPPTLMKMRGAVSRSTPTRTVSADSNSRVALEDRAPRHAAEPALDAGSGAGRHCIGACLDPGHVDLRRRRDDAVVCRAPHDVRGVGAGDQRLGGHAAGVHTGAAEQLALDERDRHAGGRQPARQRWTRLAGPDDDRVEAASRQHRHDQERAADGDGVLDKGRGTIAAERGRQPPRARRGRRACRSPRRSIPAIRPDRQ